MSNNNLVETIKAQIKKDSTQYKVFNLLSDEQWHCRDCEGKQIGCGQYAGGGRIQGLERGTRSRPGLLIETESRYCNNCHRITRQDHWTGEIKTANSAANIPDALVERILKVYSYTDVIEQRKRSAHELVIDHRSWLISGIAVYAGRSEIADSIDLYLLGNS